MKKLLFMLLMLPLMSMAQVKDDSKYLSADAVPVENGRVIFTKEIEIPMNVADIYSAAQEWLNNQYAPVKDMPNHKVLSTDRESYELNAGGEEWMVFANKFLSLDRTRVYYKINLACYDKKIVARIFNINYWYEEEREGGTKYNAEEWITNEWALNKKGTKLSKRSGKFRSKTIDRTEEIFDDLEAFINKKAIKSIMK
ncbi:MAG: DUF4468 domain-containing protein [Bacteroidaceae bacterium]|nr:DUF4468 domain-containing protein [Bacteroidaceae bacterium]